MNHSSDNVVVIDNARVSFGGRTIFDELELTISAGEFLAVLGPNGAGKTTLLKTLLGLTRLSVGTISVCGIDPQQARAQVGYIPQQRAFPADIAIRGRDLVQFGFNGTRPGFARTSRSSRDLIDRSLDTVDAKSFADAPLGELSGGEQQRLRVAQALLTDPKLLLCDEPLLSLDPAHQHNVCELINKRREVSGTAVVFVTHEINPVLPYVDRVLYLAGGKWTIGQPDDVLTTKKLSELYGSHIEVVRVGERIMIVGADAEESAHHHHEHGGVH